MNDPIDTLGDLIEMLKDEAESRGEDVKVRLKIDETQPPYRFDDMPALEYYKDDGEDYLMIGIIRSVTLIFALLFATQANAAPVYFNDWHRTDVVTDYGDTYMGVPVLSHAHFPTRVSLVSDNETFLRLGRFEIWDTFRSSIGLEFPPLLIPLTPDVDVYGETVAEGWATVDGYGYRFHMIPRLNRINILSAAWIDGVLTRTYPPTSFAGGAMFNAFNLADLLPIPEPTIGGIVAPILYVLCANCRRRNPDGGKRKSCEYCGCFPLPSYKYDKSSSFHPDNCNGSTEKRSPVQINYRRITPKPTLNLK